MHRPDTGQRENVRKRPASPLHKPQPVCRGVRGIGLSSASAVCLRRLLYSGTERQAGPRPECGGWGHGAHCPELPCPVSPILSKNTVFVSFEKTG